MGEALALREELTETMGRFRTMSRDSEGTMTVQWSDGSQERVRRHQEHVTGGISLLPEQNDLGPLTLSVLKRKQEE